MSRRVVGITLDTLADFPAACRDCAYWELAPAADVQARQAGSTAFEKEAWVSDTLLQWGGCGQLVYVDDSLAGYALYAPPDYVPRSAAFATSPVASDAILLMTACVLPAHAGTGLGRLLLQAVARDAVQRGIRAIEAFGRQDAPSRPGEAYRCVLPAGYLRAVGFRTVRPHPQVSRLRLDVRSTVTWRADVQYAIERLFGGIPSTVSTP